jgi:NAD-dependent SIR2 family protein deacetylase
MVCDMSKWKQLLGKAERVTVLKGAKVAEINLEETPNSGMMDFVSRGKAGEIIAKLVHDSL